MPSSGVLGIRDDNINDTGSKGLGCGAHTPLYGNHGKEIGTVFRV